VTHDHDIPRPSAFPQSRAKRDVIATRENTKIVETNSTNRLESTKARKNELKTNSKRTGKEAEISTMTVRIRPNEANSFSVSLPLPLPDGLKQIGRSVKDVKIVGTNSTSLLESTKPLKNEHKTNPGRSEKQLDKGAIRVKSSHAPRIAVRLFHLAKACRAETNALADDGKPFFDDRSGNVIENKGGR